ncbi:MULTISPECIES: 6-phospho-beta-glucosidase [Anaerolinea]|uniref:6-phospho-beta-glucosidase n=1 Tax=Anaerolinea TaxID=233189 RepID=UPI0026174988|nr:6-phospho-beta-glucosidase [Anaerolinea thermophila]
MKIAVIGGGSTYTPELIKGFLEVQDSLQLDELMLMDIQPQRLEIVGDFCQRIAEHQGARFRVTLTDSRREAIQGSAYVLTQFRVGFIPARREDEYLGKRYGLIGQETTGIGGMAKALRTIPVLLDIAREMQKIAPKAMLVNFTNPSGLVMEALTRYAPDILSVGLCNSPITTKMNLLARWNALTGENVTPEEVVLDSLGLNHLTWYRGVNIRGEDRWAEILRLYLEELRQSEHPEWPPQLIEALGMLPNYYLQYYYNTRTMLAAQEKWPPSRAEQVMKIEAKLLEEYANPKLVSVPEDLMQRGGAYYSTLATRVIHAHACSTGMIETVNVRQNGAVREYPADWVMELPCRIDSSGIHPLPARPLPEACYGLLAPVKMYELLTVEAAVHGDRKALYEALLVHPLGPDVSMMDTVIDDLLRTNRAYLPQFF